MIHHIGITSPLHITTLQHVITTTYEHDKKYMNDMIQQQFDRVRARKEMRLVDVM